MRFGKNVAVSIVACLTLLLSGCSAIVAVADAAVTVGATAVKITAKTVGAAVDLVIPDSDKKKKEEK
jgi:uncharacterized protein YceK